MRRIRRQAVTNETAGASGAGEPTLFKIGEVARRAGVGVETLRFYERSGLLDRPARTEGGYRLYDATHFSKRGIEPPQQPARGPAPACLPTTQRAWVDAEVMGKLFVTEAQKPPIGEYAFARWIRLGIIRAVAKERNDPRDEAQLR